MESLYSYVNGSTEREGSRRTVEWRSPTNPSLIFGLKEADDDTVHRAVQSAADAFTAESEKPLHYRLQWLLRAADLLEQRRDEVARVLVEDIGKPIRAATVEVQRGVDFLRTCAATLPTLTGETLALDAKPAGAEHLGFTLRVPYGVVAAITPFNAPINLLLQKVAPALGMGNAVVAKPHPAGTRAALMMADVFKQAGLPASMFNVVIGDRDPAAALASHPQVRVVTFTGGTAAGRALARAAASKKFVAELGSNSANIVLRDAEIDEAAQRIAAAAFEASGQQCVSAQRIIVESPIYDEFLEKFVSVTRKLNVGDPLDPTVDLGPMVSIDAAQRVMELAERTIAAGARYALAPEREETAVSPGILVDAPLDSAIWQEEVFGPLAVVVRADDAEAALALANDSPFGLQGAVFTNDLEEAMRFARRFEVGALWINEASRFRLDVYPFGGAKESGFGREGVKYALEEMSQLKFVGIRTRRGSALKA